MRVYNLYIRLRDKRWYCVDSLTNKKDALWALRDSKNFQPNEQFKLVHFESTKVTR